jgi:hypothetical protein
VVEVSIPEPNLPGLPAVFPIIKEAGQLCKMHAIVDEERPVCRQSGGLVIDRRIHRPKFLESTTTPIGRKSENRIPTVTKSGKINPVLVTAMLRHGTIQQRMDSLGIVRRPTARLITLRADYQEAAGERVTPQCMIGR